MNDPQQPTFEPEPPPSRGGQAPSPFDRPTGDAAGPRPGIAKPLLFGCGALLLLLVGAIVVFVAYQNVVMEWVIEATESQVSPLLPGDLPAATRERYDAAFERAKASARAGTYDPFALQKLQRELARLLTAREAGELSVADVERLIEVVESLPGSAPGAGPEPPG